MQLLYYLLKDGFTTVVIRFAPLNEKKLTILYSQQLKKTHKKVEITILIKSSFVSLDGLYSRGELDTPVRIRISWEEVS
ncbi:hypothetical protein UT300018_12920 [Clostridium faecium]